MLKYPGILLEQGMCKKIMLLKAPIIRKKRAFQNMWAKNFGKEVICD
jgi:hypothetical protein